MIILRQHTFFSFLPQPWMNTYCTFPAIQLSQYTGKYILKHINQFHNTHRFYALYKVSDANICEIIQINNKDFTKFKFMLTGM